MYSSIDLATARIERQVRKWKEKIRDHKPHVGPGVEFREVVIPAEELEPRPAGAGDGHAKVAKADKAVKAEKGKAAKPAAAGFRVVKDETFSARSMSVEDAVMQLNLLGDDLIVFTDAGTKSISILYRRKDGNYGLIETGSSGAPSA
jgi:putative sigma-54 modulation protein